MDDTDENPENFNEKEDRMKQYVCISLLCLLPVAGLSQEAVELTLGIGSTAIDIENLVEKDEIDGTTASDWETFNVGVAGRYFFASNSTFDFGAELMYQYLYWYSVRVPYGSQPIHREYDVSAVRITPILRYGIESNLSFDIGPELNFMDGVNLGLLVAANYVFPLSDAMEIPLSVRLDIMNNIVMTMPVSVNAGIRISL